MSLSDVSGKTESDVKKPRTNAQGVREGRSMTGTIDHTISKLDLAEVIDAAADKMAEGWFAGGSIALDYKPRRVPGDADIHHSCALTSLSKVCYDRGLMHEGDGLGPHNIEARREIANTLITDGVLEPHTHDTDISVALMSWNDKQEGPGPVINAYRRTAQRLRVQAGLRGVPVPPMAELHQQFDDGAHVHYKSQAALIPPTPGSSDFELWLNANPIVQVKRAARANKQQPAPQPAKKVRKPRKGPARIRVTFSRHFRVAEVEHLRRASNIAPFLDELIGLKLRLDPSGRLWAEADMDSRDLYSLVTQLIESTFVNVFPTAVRTFREYKS